MERFIKTKFYSFNQNNSGGIFETNQKKGIGGFVIIEAISATHANGRAEDLGIYFNGCRDGHDCPCCGDRWYRVDESDGYDVPSIFGTPVEQASATWGRENVYIHLLDGSITDHSLKKK